MDDLSVARQRTPEHQLHGRGTLDPDDRDAQKAHAQSLSILGALYLDTGRFEDAADYLSRGTNIFLLLVDLAAANPEPDLVNMTIMVVTELAKLQQSLGRLDEAAAAEATAEELSDRYPDAKPSDGN